VLYLSVMTVKCFGLQEKELFFFKLCIDWFLVQFNIMMDLCGIIRERGTYRSILMVEGFVLCISY
jgi:hypothetical protein